MPRATKNPVVFLALSPAAVATALSIEPQKVYRAVAEGKLIVRQLGVSRRIGVFGEGGVQEWFESWPQAKQRKRRTVPHVQ